MDRRAKGKEKGKVLLNSTQRTYRTGMPINVPKKSSERIAETIFLLYRVINELSLSLHPFGLLIIVDYLQIMGNGRSAPLG